ncbi:MAG: tetratricopeptide repeat protein, partial [Myxococcota bacterium]
PLDPHLQRLVELDRKLADRDLETQCAIAQLHLVLGEPEPAWRRLEAILADAGPWQGRAEHIAANALRRLGRHDEALACYERAIAHFEMAGRRRELGLVLSNLGGLHVERSDAERARRCWSRALRCFAVEGDARAEAVTLGDLGLLDHEAGDLETAERRYRRALELHEELNNRRSVGIVCCDLGELLLTRGSPIEARDVLLRGLEALTSIGDGRQRVLAEAALALAETQTGEDGQARLDIARDRAPDDLSEVMELYAAALRLDQARRARQDGKQDEERAILNAAEELLARVGTTPDEVRRVGRLLRAELERHRRSAGWAIAADASFFLTPEQERIDLSRRHVFRRLLAALLQARLSSPGETLTLEDLLRAGWPGQRVMQAAARNRLHVALSGLRKLGLDPLLQKRRQGYLLDPAIEIYLPDRR